MSTVHYARCLVLGDYGIWIHNKFGSALLSLPGNFFFRCSLLKKLTNQELISESRTILLLQNAYRYLPVPCQMDMAALWISDCLAGESRARARRSLIEQSAYDSESVRAKGKTAHSQTKNRVVQMHVCCLLPTQTQFSDMKKQELTLGRKVF